MVELREAYFVRQCRLDHLHISYSVRFQIRLQRLQRRLGGFYSHDCLVVFAGLKCPEATVCACVNEQLPICKNSVSTEVLSMIEDSVEGHNEPVLPFTVDDVFSDYEPPVDQCRPITLASTMSPARKHMAPTRTNVGQ